MNLEQFSRTILSSGKLEDKLINPSIISSLEGNSFSVDRPLRDLKYDFSNKKNKFPKIHYLEKDEGTAKALHFFANHELLAIEIMAAALMLDFKNQNEAEELKIKQQILNTIAEEQKHFKLYQAKFNQLGVEFGDHPNNDFFWKLFKQTSSIEEYFALVSLTFEQANLDFAQHFHHLFNKIERKETANIMKTVLNDEISHVGLGYFWLNKWNTRPMREVYLELLPELVTPSRAKGISFCEEPRQRAKLDQDFINFIRDYNDDYKITSRKQWKK